MNYLTVLLLLVSTIGQSSPANNQSNQESPSIVATAQVPLAADTNVLDTTLQGKFYGQHAVVAYSGNSKDGVFIFPGFKVTGLSATHGKIGIAGSRLLWNSPSKEKENYLVIELESLDGSNYIEAAHEGLVKSGEFKETTPWFRPKLAGPSGWVVELNFTGNGRPEKLGEATFVNSVGNSKQRLSFAVNERLQYLLAAPGVYLSELQIVISTPYRAKFLETDLSIAVAAFKDASSEIRANVFSAPSARSPQYVIAHGGTVGGNSVLSGLMEEGLSITIHRRKGSQVNDDLLKAFIGNFMAGALRVIELGALPDTAVVSFIDANRVAITGTVGEIKGIAEASNSEDENKLRELHRLATASSSSGHGGVGFGPISIGGGGSSQSQRDETNDFESFKRCAQSAAKNFSGSLPAVTGIQFDTTGRIEMSNSARFDLKLESFLVGWAVLEYPISLQTMIGSENDPKSSGVGFHESFYGSLEAAKEIEKAGGLLIADGRALSSKDYPALYKVIGTQYGSGFNREHQQVAGCDFNLPDAMGFVHRFIDPDGRRDVQVKDRLAPWTGANGGAASGSIQGFATAKPTSSPLLVSEDPEHSVANGPFTKLLSYSGERTCASIDSDHQHVGEPDMLSAADVKNIPAHSHTISGGDIETRMVNMYVVPMIRVR